jgi:hydrogenase maturation protease
MSARILIAGIGNVFRRDDAFGVEVAQRLARGELPEGVRAVDFGIRGIHLAFELLDPPELLILVDAVQRDEAPGTLYVLDPQEWSESLGADGEPNGHELDVASVLRLLRTFGGATPPTRIIGCEPMTVEDGMGLSDPVRAAIAPAIAIVGRLIEQHERRNREVPHVH